MSANVRWTVEGDGAWPCSCGGTGAATNPPPDLAGVLDLYGELGDSLAVGELARRLGFPIGAELTAKVGELVSGLEVDAPPETGGWVSSLTRGAVAAEEAAGGAVAAESVGARVAKSAGKAWDKLAANPGLVVRLGVILGGASAAFYFLSSEQSRKLEESRDLRKLTADALSRVPPAEAAKLLLAQNPFGGGAGGGLGVGGYLALGAGVLGLLWLWRQFGGRS